MKTPEEFRYFTSCFWDGSHRESDSERLWVARALKMSTRDEQLVIKAFVRELLERDASVEEFQQAWRSGSSVYGIHNDKIRDFFALIRDSIVD